MYSISSIVCWSILAWFSTCCSPRLPSGLSTGLSSAVFADVFAGDDADDIVAVLPNGTLLLAANNGSQFYTLKQVPVRATFVPPLCVCVGGRGGGDTVNPKVCAPLCPLLVHYLSRHPVAAALAPLSCAPLMPTVMACWTLLLGAALRQRHCTCEWAPSLGRPQAPAPGEPPPHPLVHPRTHASQLAFHPCLPHSSLVCVSWCTLLRPTRRGLGNGSFVLSPSFGTALAPLGNVTALAPSVGIGKQCDSKVGVAVVASGILYVVTFFADGTVAPVTHIPLLSEVVAVAVGSVSLGDTPDIVGCTASGVLFVVRVPCAPAPSTSSFLSFPAPCSPSVFGCTSLLSP
jgi:hypothetical protein